MLCKFENDCIGLSRQVLKRHIDVQRKI